MNPVFGWKSVRTLLLSAVFSSLFLLPCLVTLAPAWPGDSAPRAYFKVEPKATPSNEVETLSIQVGRSLLIDLADPAERVSISNADVAEAVPVSPQQLMINGKSSGTTTLVIWDKTGRRNLYELLVQVDTSTIAARIKEAFPTEQITVSSARDSIILAGLVTSEYVMNKAIELANLYTKNVANLMRVPETVPKDEPQILLQVKFAEVDRTVEDQLGVNLTRMADSRLVGTVGTGQFGSNPSIAPITSESITPFPRGTPVSTKTQFTFTDLVGIFAWKTDLNLAATIHALQTKGLLQILAEPNLVTRNGKEASFLAGGEFPFAVAQNIGTGVPVITIQFKEFGIKLKFTPTLLPSGTVRLKIMPEVSDLDFTNTLQMSGFVVPSIKTRRADTEIELRDGQSFAIAGLLDNRVLEDYRKIPVLADIPIIGYLFKSRLLKKSNTDLVVLVTPRVVKPQLDSSEVPPIPEVEKPFLREKNFEGKFGHQEQKK